MAYRAAEGAGVADGQSGRGEEAKDELMAEVGDCAAAALELSATTAGDSDVMLRRDMAVKREAPAWTGWP